MRAGRLPRSPPCDRTRGHAGEETWTSSLPDRTVVADVSSSGGEARGWYAEHDPHPWRGNTALGEARSQTLATTLQPTPVKAMAGAPTGHVVVLVVATALPQCCWAGVGIAAGPTNTLRVKCGLNVRASWHGGVHVDVQHAEDGVRQHQHLVGDDDRLQTLKDKGEKGNREIFIDHHVPNGFPPLCSCLR